VLQLYTPLPNDTNPLPSAGAARGQSLVEFALTFPFFLIVLLVAIQLALIVMQYYSLISVTGETVRWLAVHPDTVDADVIAHARASPMTLDPDRFTSITPSPGCPALAGGRCTSRTTGDVLTLEIRYDMGNLLFLPTTFGFGTVTVSIPRSLPSYRVSVLIE
jgi:TadE-like protein